MNEAQSHTAPVLVVHSGAGVFVPVIVDKVRPRPAAVVFVDASIPPESGEARLVPAEFVEELRAKAVGGVLREAAMARSSLASRRPHALETRAPGRRSPSRRCVADATSSTAASKAGRLAGEGARYPLILRTNCNAAARISSSPAGCCEERRVLMLRHMDQA